MTAAQTGDIIAVVKLKETQTGDTLCDKSNAIRLSVGPIPRSRRSPLPSSRNHAPTKTKSRPRCTKFSKKTRVLQFRPRRADQGIYSCPVRDNLHIETVVDKLKNQYDVEVALHPPKVPYKETITQQVEVQGRHKKQSGGRGQFGDCKCIFEPLERGAGFEFVDKIFGGSIPQNFRPAIEKGIVEAAPGGAIAGYPLVDFKVTLIDGSYHTVDSDEHSFRAAGRKAFRNAMEKARPTCSNRLWMSKFSVRRKFPATLWAI